MNTNRGGAVAARQLVLILGGEHAVTPRDMTRIEPHGFAATVTIATCECGATFEGASDGQALSMWALHAEACES